MLLSDNGVICMGWVVVVLWFGLFAVGAYVLQPVDTVGKAIIMMFLMFWPVIAQFIVDHTHKGD